MAPDLYSKFTRVANFIKNNAQRTIQESRFVGVKGAGAAGTRQTVTTHLYSVSGRTYYYTETAAGNFVSAGLYSGAVLP